ncbi:lytic polysaccharide monooxygenase [Isoptericola sp. NPDC019482]|uniref:lytic polysaccharide monooxygenase n=1 Tax=Isoptericola sp. NPDC019482 TaxID=3154688 RepID=UPI00346D7841
MRRLAASLAATVLAAVGLVAVVGQPAAAHGAEVFPGSRQYLCWVDAQTATGQLDPSNPACADALAQSGPNAYYNWFGNLDSNGAGRTEGYIPDGTICSGGDRGPYDFSAFNAPRTDWPTTHLTAGETYEFQHNNWAEHPGRFDVYVTREGFDPTQPLGWADLELVDSVTDPPDTGGPGGDNYYYWDVTLPADRTGEHIVFTHWVRSDSSENFYSCSDVAFDGGDGEVTGIDGETDPDPDPTDPPEVCPDEVPGTPLGELSATSVTATKAHIMWGAGTTGCVTGYDVIDVATGEILASTDGVPMIDVTGLEPGTTYEVAVRARNDNTGEVSEPTASVTFTTLTEDEDPGTDPDPGACTATFSTTNSWSGGYQGEIVVTAGDAALDGWQVAADGITTSNIWGGALADGVISPAAWNATLGAGQSTTVGFIGTGTAPADGELACS